MVLYRPRAMSYEDSMRQVLIFHRPADLDFYLINHHKLGGFTTGGKPVIVQSPKEMNDERNGWRHCHLKCIGNLPIGISDIETLREFPAPDKLNIEAGADSGYDCRFKFLEQEYFFHVGLAPWTETNECVGFICDGEKLLNKIFRQSNVIVSSECLREIIISYILNRAMARLNLEATT